MKSEFWKEIIESTGEENGQKLPFFSLAPMEAVTDVVFRHVVSKAARPDIYYTEFTNSSSFASPKGIHSTRGRLTFTPDEQPIIAQIWGSRPADIKFMCEKLPELGYRAIDINMGCPDKAVIKSGGGSDLIRNPDLAKEIIESAKAGGLPVSVKTRLGFSRVEEWHDWLKFLLEQKIEVLTIHLRTKKEMSKVPAHFELIPEILKLRDEIAPDTLIQINGDIKSRAQGLELWRKYPKIDGIMIGRGIFENPFCFEKNPPETARTSSDYLDLLELQLDLFEKYSRELEKRRFEPLKRFFKIYVREFASASDLRAKLMETKTVDEVREILKDFRNATQK
ncbi:MAG: tRNA-dihydrouridine synthase family protein [Candidatus Nanogingivalaceae bacterium]|nr:tRNA-dihydrouridine synthase family protein [Candidatus Nanogingivalaceae bacterium]